MLEGINILSQVEITKMPNWCSTVYMVVAIIIFVAILLYGIICEHDFAGGVFLGLALGLFSGLIVYVVLELFVPNSPTGEYTYKVTISDEMNYKEFTERYEVIDVEGLIYTIEEK